MTSDLIERQAQAGAALYWAMYHAEISVVSGLPQRVLDAYMRAQDVFGTTKPHRVTDPQGARQTAMGDVFDVASGIDPGAIPANRIGEPAQPPADQPPADPPTSRPYIDPVHDRLGGSSQPS